MLMLGSTPVAEDNLLIPERDAVDHLLLGVSDLDEGISWVERATGVRAIVGGSHPGRGTRNALLSLGGRQYLEVVAPDPAQSSTAQGASLLTLKEPRLIGWAAASEDLGALSTKARGSGLELMGPRDGSRATPGGKLLRWRTISVVKQFSANGVDPIPFFIEWAADSVHPSQDSPRGCELQSFEIAHPNSEAVRETLRRLGIDAAVRQAETARLVATLRTPKGVVVLDSTASDGAQTRKASGTFDVKLTPQSSDDGRPDGPALGRMSIDKQFHGDLAGISKGEMLTATGAVKESAGYVAIERVTGTLHGRKGSFALQHSGFMTRGAPQLTITVVPDSGTGELTGLEGTMTIRIEGENHFYEMDYTLQR
jgi:hypothetical protein